ncbi:MAG: Rpn family recombination-promoting nuclease/putative transposase [Fibrobacteres bacterium]|nr:Rpn family recombination-promoting nuclease/putative transposase [Fibrobacterota bacterium]
MPRPHDPFFKAIFSDVGHAKDLLRGVLPAAVLDSLDLDHLEPEPASFVSDSLDESFSDLIFTCPLQGNQAVVAILLEHKTWQPKHIHLQIFRYMVSIWEADQAENRALRPVIPILVHQGPAPWKLAGFHESFPMLPDSLRAFIPDIRLVFEDLAVVDDQSIGSDFQDPVVRAALALMKHIFSAENTLAVARSLTPDLGTGLDDDQAVRTLRILLEYILDAGVPEVRDHLFQSLHPNLKGQAMTLGDLLRQEGRVEGEIKGKAEGLREAKIQDARKLREHGISWEIITDVTGLRPEDLEAPQET